MVHLVQIEMRKQTCAFAVLALFVAGPLLPADLFDPLFAHAWTAVRRGEFPFWSSAVAGGTPFFAAWQMPVLSPFAIVGYLLPLPVALIWLALAPAIVGGVGVFVIARGIGGPLWLAVLLGLGFAVGLPRMGAAANVWAPWLLPWMLIATERVLENGGGKAIAFVAMMTALMMSSGRTGIILFTPLLIARYAAWEADLGRRPWWAMRRPRWRMIGAVMLGGSLGILACGVQVVPFLEYMAQGGEPSLRSGPLGPGVSLRLHPELEFIKQDRDVFRIMELGEPSVSSAALAHGVQSALPKDALSAGWYRKLIRNAGGVEPLLDQLNVKYVVTDANVLPRDRWTLEYSAINRRVYRNTGVMPRVLLPDAYVVMPDDEAARAFASRTIDPRKTVVFAADPGFQSIQSASVESADAAVIRHYSDHRVTIEANVSGPRVLVLTDTYYPGWEATIDDRAVPIHRANVAFRAIALPEGRHIVEFRYRPWSLLYGLIVSVVGIFLVAAVARSNIATADDTEQRSRAARRVTSRTRSALRKPASSTSTTSAPRRPSRSG